MTWGNSYAGTVSAISGPWTNANHDFVSTPLPEFIVTEGLVVWYRYQDGQAIDSASDSRFPGVTWGDGTNFDATVSGGTPTDTVDATDVITGGNSRGSSLDGVDDVITDGSTTVTGSFSVVVVALFDSLSGFTAGFRTLMAQGAFNSADWAVYYDSFSDGLIVTSDGRFSEGDTPVSTGAVNVFGTSVDASAGTVQHYLNGNPKPVTDSSGTVTASDSGQTLRMGFDTDKDRLIDGSLFECRLYDRPVSDSEHATIAGNILV